MSYTFTQTGSEIQAILDRAETGGQLDQDIAAKQDVLTFDAVPTEGSTNPAESGGIYDAIQAGGAAALAAFATDSVSGDVVSFPDGADGIPVKAFTGSIIPAQSGSGDPAPDNIRPISGWTGANIYRTGVNGISTYEKGGIDSATGADNANANACRTGYIPVKDEDYYLLIDSTFGGSCYPFCYDINKTFVAALGTKTASGVISITDPSVAFVRLSFYKSGSGWGTTLPYRHDAFNYPSTVTTYQPYNGSAILLDFGQTVYAGTLTALGGGLWKIQPTHKIDALDSHTWNYGGNNRFNATGFSDMKQDGLRSEYIYCSCYAPNVGGGAYDPFTIYNGTGGYLYVVDDRTTDGATLKTLLAGQKMVYPLATLPDPIIVSGEDLQTLLGANTVWQSCGAVTEMTYRADTALYIQKLIGGGGTLSTLSMASPSPSLSLGRVGVLAEPEADAEPEEVTEEPEADTEEATEE